MDALERVTHTRIFLRENLSLVRSSVVLVAVSEVICMLEDKCVVCENMMNTLCMSECGMCADGFPIDVYICPIGAVVPRFLGPF